MIMYRTMWSTGIEAVEVIRKTENQVVYLNDRGVEQRENKRSEWQNWHDTWEQARDFLMECSQNKVDVLRRQLELIKGGIVNTKGMKH